MKQFPALAAQKKKLLLVLPVLALPFITLALWALGFIGSVQTPKVKDTPGINKQVPGAQIATGDMPDKMSLYDLAAKDSELWREQLRFAPDTETDTSTAANDLSLFSDSLAAYSNGGVSTGLQMNNYSNPSETRLRSKLAELQKSMNEPQPAVVSNATNDNADSELERAYQRLQQEHVTSTPDPELQQLNGLLDKITDIQNPARVQQRLKETSQKNRGRIYAVKTQDGTVEAGVLQSADAFASQSRELSAGFYDVEQALTPEDSMQPTGISAEVNETQTLVAGSTVKMRLTQNVFVNGIGIPYGSFVSGICTIEGERLKIAISTIRYDYTILPVNLAVFDLDGIEGIRITGAISRDAAKEGADRALQSVQLMSLDPSIGAQAAGAGVEAAKSLFSKKAKLIRVVVKAGHPVVLVDMKARQEQQ